MTATAFAPVKYKETTRDQWQAAEAWNRRHLGEGGQHAIADRLEDHATMGRHALLEQGVVAGEGRWHQPQVLLPQS